MGGSSQKLATPCLVSKFKSYVMAMKKAAMKAMKAKKAAAPEAAPKKKAMKAMKAKAMKAKKGGRTTIERTSGMARCQNFGESVLVHLIPIDLMDLTACMLFIGVQQVLSHVKQILFGVALFEQ